MIITVFKPSGQKTSFSIDDDVIRYLDAAKIDYRTILKDEALSGSVNTSKDARRHLLRLIVKPSLVNRAQMDIEDF